MHLEARGSLKLTDEMENWQLQQDYQMLKQIEISINQLVINMKLNLQMLFD